MTNEKVNENLKENNIRVTKVTRMILLKTERCLAKKIPMTIEKILDTQSIFTIDKYVSNLQPLANVRF